MSSDSEGSPPPGSSSCFPPNYLQLLQGLPLPERYLINSPGLPGQEDATYTEISIPTQTNSVAGGVAAVGPGAHLAHLRQQVSRQDDDTDLDASDFEDEEVLHHHHEVETRREEEGHGGGHGRRLVAAVSGHAANGSINPHRSDSVPTAHVYPSPAAAITQPRPASNPRVTFSPATPHSQHPQPQHWNIYSGEGDKRGAGSTEFSALQVDHHNETLAVQFHDRDPVRENVQLADRDAGIPMSMVEPQQSKRDRRSPLMQYGDYHEPSSTVVAAASSVYDHRFPHSSSHTATNFSATHSTYNSDYNTTGYNTGADMRTHSDTVFGSSSSRMAASALYSQPMLRPGQEDITMWQRRHQEQLRRQHLDSTQSLHASSTYLPPHSDGLASSLLVGDPHKLDAIKEAADNIIKEKDKIIDRQKMAILDLESRGKSSEAEINRTLLKKIQQENEGLQMRLQEMEYQKATLKAQVAEVRGGASSYRDQLEKKLGETEYAMRELQISSEKDINSKIVEIDKLQKQLQLKDDDVCEWKDKTTQAQKICDDLQEKIASLERYLEDMPTADEKARKSLEMRSLKDDKQKYKQRISELEKRLLDANKGIKSREGLIESLEDVNSQLQGKIKSMKDDKAALEDEVVRLRGPDADDIDELKYENKKLRADLEKARKLLEMSQKKVLHVESRLARERGEGEQRLQQEETTVTGLRQDLANMADHVKKLKLAAKELKVQNQDLLEKKLSLSDRVRELEGLHGSDTAKLERKLMKEMNICFVELQSLVQICVQKAEGQDPNISALLGVKGACGADLADSSSEDNIQSLKYRVSKIRDLRNEVDKLRELISNKYAEDMGENLNCTTQ